MAQLSLEWDGQRGAVGGFGIHLPANLSWERLWRDLGRFWDPFPTKSELGEATEGFWETLGSPSH